MEEIYEPEESSVYQNGRLSSERIDLQIRPSLSIVLPTYNEANNIRGVVLEYLKEIASKLPSKLVVAEDGSFDGTKEILFSLANEVPISLLSSANRKGYAKGVRDALESCSDSFSAEWLFFSDSDGQYFPSDFWRLWDNRESYDMIIGHKVHRNEGIHRTALSKVFHRLANSLFGLNLHDGDCGFRLIRKEVIKSIVAETRILEYSFWTEFTIRASLKGFRICEMPINHANRTNGSTHVYAPSKIPLIVLKQLKGLLELFVDVRRSQ